MKLEKFFFFKMFTIYLSSLILFLLIDNCSGKSFISILNRNSIVPILLLCFQNEIHLIRLDQHSLFEFLKE